MLENIARLSLFRLPTLPSGLPSSYWDLATFGLLICPVEPRVHSYGSRVNCIVLCAITRPS